MTVLYIVYSCNNYQVTLHNHTLCQQTLPWLSDKKHLCWQRMLDTKLTNPFHLGLLGCEIEVLVWKFNYNIANVNSER